MRFGLPARAPAEMIALFKQADIASAYYEATQLAGFTADEAKRYFGTPSKALRTPRLLPLSAADAQALFLERFRRLLVPSPSP